MAVSGLSISSGTLFRADGPPPSDQVNVGLIGCKNRGFSVLKNHLDLGSVNCVGICDVDSSILGERAKELEAKYDQSPTQYKDFRRLLENKDLDAVIIGTPDHWHCLPTVYACQQGLDVYVEKPMANSIEECTLMVEAANKYDQIVQVGQQQRSGRVWAEVMDYLHSGKLGTIRKVNCWANFNYGVGSPAQPNQSPPESLEWDFWLGPAPEKPYSPNRFNSWRMFWDYGGGLMTDWGVHLIDMALWVKNVTDPPTEILSHGKNLSYESYEHETYDTMSVVFPMDDYVINWQHTAGMQAGRHDRIYGIEVIGDRGILVADRSSWNVIPAYEGSFEEDRIEPLESEPNEQGHQPHAKNFVECIKSRDEPNCPPELGRAVALYAHTANIAARTGEGKLVWNDDNHSFAHSSAANNYIVPYYRDPWSLPTP